MTEPQSPVTLTREGRVAVVTLKRGDRLNALSGAVMLALTEVAQALRGDTSTSAVILTGDPVFSAGADLADPARHERAHAKTVGGPRRKVQRRRSAKHPSLTQGALGAAPMAGV